MVELYNREMQRTTAFLASLGRHSPLISRSLGAHSPLSVGERFGDRGWRRPSSQEALDKKVEGHSAAATFHASDAGLTGPDPLGELSLCPLAPLSSFSKFFAQRELHLHDLRFDVVQLQKVRRATHAPSGCFETLLLSLFHLDRFFPEASS